MLLLSNSCNFWAKLLDNFTAWVVRGGSEWRGGGGGEASWVYRTEITLPSLKAY